MEYLTVKNWEKFQHYKNRCPPWIKLHSKVLNDRKFASLSAAQRGWLIQLWVLASENDGQVPYDIKEIQFRLRDKEIKISDINILIQKGFLKNCKQMLADASPETETETETEYSPPIIPPLTGEEKHQKSEKEIFGEFENVRLTLDEFRKLKDRFGEIEAIERIERLSEYIASKGKRYKSHYATILSWDRKDKKPP